MAQEREIDPVIDPNKQPEYGGVTFNETPPFQRFERARGLYKTVSAVPTYVPISPDEQIVYYKSGATLRLYVYDVSNNVWSYATLT